MDQTTADEQQADSENHPSKGNRVGVYSFVSQTLEHSVPHSPKNFQRNLPRTVSKESKSDKAKIFEATNYDDFRKYVSKVYESQQLSPNQQP